MNQNITQNITENIKNLSAIERHRLNVRKYDKSPKGREWHRKWRQEHKDIYYRSTVNARKKSRKIALQLLAGNNKIPRCNYCGTTKRLEIDHKKIDGLPMERFNGIIKKKAEYPLTLEVRKCDEATRNENYQILCHDCNTFKNIINQNLFEHVKTQNFKALKYMMLSYKYRMPIEDQKAMIYETAKRNGFEIDWKNKIINKI
ncbi:MAG: hypothetical protein QXX01_03220 [Candidatus Aenigmatarchaeota archaeon]